MIRFKILTTLLLYSFISFSQDVAINMLWEHGSGLHSADFGVKTALDANHNYYELGVNLSSTNLYSLEVIKYSKGEQIWTLALDSMVGIDYVPTNLNYHNGVLYAAAFQPQAINGRSLIYAISEAGSLNWIHDTIGDIIVTDVKVDDVSNQIVLTGSIGNSGSRDAFVEARGLNGNPSWWVSLDQYGFNDVALNLGIMGNEYVVSGSSESGYQQWEMASWYLRSDGRLTNYQSGSRFSNAIDELKDGRLSSSGLVLVGESFTAGQKDLKVYAYDLNKNLVWQDAFDRQGLDEYALAIEETTTGDYIVVGASVSATSKSDAFIRAYSAQGNVLWTNIIDIEGGDDEARAVVEDLKGNLLVLCNSEFQGQQDVLLICLDKNSGAEKWRTKLSSSLQDNDAASGLHVNRNGEIWITYQEGFDNQVSVVKYEELNVPSDFEVPSRSNMFIENRGQLRNSDNAPIPEVKYYSQGHRVPYFFSDAGFIALQGGGKSAKIQGDSLQRIDFNFQASNSASVAALASSKKETYFNIYENLEAYESCESFGVLAYPNIYENIDAYMHSNSEGFKMSLYLKPGAQLEDIQLQIKGANGLKLQSGNLKVQTISGDLTYLAPFSYPENGPAQNDGCLQYELLGDVLRFKSTSCEITLPYVIHIRSGQGQNHSPAAIDNLDWSTFYGGTWEEGGNDLAIDPSTGDVYLAGYAYSVNLPSTTGILNPSNGRFRGLALKFDRDAELKWGLLLGAASGPGNSNPNLSFKGLALEDNLSPTGLEVHLVGEYNGAVSGYAAVSVIPIGSYQQQSPMISGSAMNNPNGLSNRDLVLVSLNAAGTRIYTSPFGGNGIERVYCAQVRNGHFYFAGSTDNGSTNGASSSLPPSNHVFPVYNPQDGSFFRAVHPSAGNERAFVAALDLSTYQLSYSSIITRSSNTNSDYTAIYNLRGDYYVGKSQNGARQGFFDNNRMFSASLNYSHTEDSDKSYFSDVAASLSPNGDADLYYFGFDGNGNDPLAPTVSPTSYQSSLGEAYLIKRREAAINWETYFGPQTGQNATWNFNGGLWASNFDTPDSKGRMAYSQQSGTLFIGASTNGNAPSQNFPSFFNENTNNSGTGNRADIYIAAFSSNANSHSDYFNWGTMYGEACLNCSFGLGSGFGQDYLSDLDLYYDGTEEYLYVLGTSYSTTGTLISNVDLFPVADLGLANSFFQQNNAGSYDIVISRFKVSGIGQGLGVQELVLPNEIFSVYPNPNKGDFTIASTSEQPIEEVKLCTLQGQVIEAWSWSTNPSSVELKTAGLAAGVYVLKVNGSHAQQIIIH